MDSIRREQIRHSLRTLAETYRSAIDVFEKTLAVLCDEFSLDPVVYFHTQVRQATVIDPTSLRIDHGMFSVHFKGSMCFLGNTLPFRFLCRLADQPGVYVSYEDLLSSVWDGVRSGSAVRSVVKILRGRLRAAKLDELAAAIDGTVSNHYALHPPT